jgi:hypothetical protein
MNPLCFTVPLFISTSPFSVWVELTFSAGRHPLVSCAGGAPWFTALQHGARHVERWLHFCGNGYARRAVVSGRLGDRPDIQDLSVSVFLSFRVSLERQALSGK